MFSFYQKPIIKWIGAFILSILFHLFFGYYYFYKKEITINELVASAVIVDFSDPPQSIVISSELPVGPPQQISTETTIEEPAESKAEPEIEELVIEEPTPPEVKPEIVVKQQKETKIVKPEKDKPKAIEKVKKEPKPNKNREAKKQPREKKTLPVADKESPAGSNVATAPPSGNSNKIASNFNSSSRGTSLEINWKALVKSHLEKRLRYPEQALRKRWKGKPVIQIILDSKGNVLSSTVISSSGKESFDREAIDNAKRSSPLPQPPADLLQNNKISINIPINFDYDNYRQ
ncbi:TonB family protein [Ursidibacter sp. B-7004-1]